MLNAALALALKYVPIGSELEDAKRIHDFMSQVGVEWPEYDAWARERGVDMGETP